MAERNDLLVSIATTTADYRLGDWNAPGPEHVERWVHQFDTDVQLPILREMSHALERTYFSLAKTKMFLSGLFRTSELVGDDPCTFWREVRFLDIQGGGASQSEMLALFDQILTEQCNIEIGRCGLSPRAFVYLDDAIFSGNRVRNDLKSWISGSAPPDAKVHIITIALHNSGHLYAKKEVEAAARAAGKTISVSWWRAIELETRKDRTNISDVLRPATIPDDPAVTSYVAGMRFPPHLRTGSHVGSAGIFSCDPGRRVLETEFLKAGAKIRQMCPQLGAYQRPLGNMVLDTLGFGSLIVTYRNCPNSAPLALWAGSPWYPLFPRATNSDTSRVFRSGVF